METDKAGIAGDQSKQADHAPSVEPKAATSVNHIDDAPDPDEDDLDDLDDMLEEFSSVKLNTKTDAPKATATTTAAPIATGPASAANATEDGNLDAKDTLPGLEDFSEEEFQKQLQAGMAELMGDLEDSASFLSPLIQFSY
ncbi:hypothetical protein FHL15_005740 [Xylaria flabelliformis]|uniref:Peroxin-19 n=1 Tax=Xylaria flabelliformis TaxID=2512241 RepID=A0A553HZW1_9PEZI|nr:hypothetical protein FHL15_005740 [Xylaria flabelliformis]